jgi:hypothetical protein
VLLRIKKEKVSGFSRLYESGPQEFSTSSSHPLIDQVLREGPLHLAVQVWIVPIRRLSGKIYVECKVNRMTTGRNKAIETPAKISCIRKQTAVGANAYPTNTATTRASTRANPLMIRDSLTLSMAIATFDQ